MNWVISKMQRWYFITIIIFHCWLGDEDRLSRLSLIGFFIRQLTSLDLTSWEEAAYDVAFLCLPVGYVLRHLLLSTDFLHLLIGQNDRCVFLFLLLLFFLNLSFWLPFENRVVRTSNTIHKHRIYRLQLLESMLSVLGVF